MIGSLQEFIGDIDRRHFLQTNRGQDRKERFGRKAHSLGKYEVLSQEQQDHINPIQLNQSVIQSGRNAYQNPKSFNSHTVEDKPNKTEQLKMKRYKEFVADDKSKLLSKYQKFQRNLDKTRDQVNIEKLRDYQSKMEHKQGQRHRKNNSIMHMKSKLKHDHQLLRSLIRVEESNSINPKTFFDISFQNMYNQFTEIKMQPQMKSPSSFQTEIVQGTSAKVKSLVDAVPVYRSDIISKYATKEIQNRKNALSLNRRLLLEDGHKWAKSRAKSTDNYEKKLGIEQIKNQKQKGVVMLKQRKDIIKKIEQLLYKPLRKKSTCMKSSSISFS